MDKDKDIQDALKAQYKRYTNGKIISRQGIDYLFSKGFDTVKLSVFIDYMKRNGILIDK